MTFKSFLNKIKHGFSNGFHAMGSFFKHGFHGIKHTVSAVAGKIQDGAHKLASIPVAVYNEAKTGVSTIYNDAKAGANKLLGFAEHGQTNFWNAVNGTVHEVGSAVNHTVGTAGKVVENAENKVTSAFSIPLLILAGGGAFLLAKSTL